MNVRSAAANVVLVHGGFGGGPGCRPVYDLLARDGYNVAVVRNPALSLAGDAAAARLIIDRHDGPVVPAGHSCGGAVITGAGADQNAAALVYPQPPSAPWPSALAPPQPTWRAATPSTCRNRPQRPVSSNRPQP